MSAALTDTRSIVNEDDGIDLLAFSDIVPSMAELGGTTIYLLDPADVYAVYPDCVRTDANGDAAEIDYEMLAVVMMAKLQAIEAGSIMYHERRTFTETTGNGVFTAEVPLPAGAVIHHAQFYSHTNWDSSTSAAMSFGYTGSLTAFINALNVKTTAPDAAGPYGAGQRFASATDLICTVTKVGTGTAGRDTLDVWYTIPNIEAATKA